LRFYGKAEIVLPYKIPPIFEKRTLSIRKIMKFITKLTLFVTISLSTLIAHADSLQVAVAANMQYVFDDLKTEFNQQTGHQVHGVFNSSGKFVSQIMNGAPFDLFLSADMEYPTALYEKKFAIHPPKTYARGILVLWTMKDININNWHAILKNVDVEKSVNGKIALANPKTAPYGRETMRLLTYFGLDKAISSRLVFGESVSQTNQYIYSGVVDMGFTAKSVVVSKEMQGKGKWLEMPSQSYSKIAQGVVILQHGQKKSPQLSRQFYDFLFSPKARAIFSAHGYELP
jgi:molybdate transport system substrate-binding protein